MKKTSQHEHFFIYHLYEQIKDKYDLSNEQMDTVMSLLGKFNDQDIKRSLMSLRKNRNPQVINNILNETKVNEKPSTEYVQEPIKPRDTFVVPMGLPLTKDYLNGAGDV